MAQTTKAVDSGRTTYDKAVTMDSRGFTQAKLAIRWAIHENARTIAEQPRGSNLWKMSIEDNVALADLLRQL